MFRSRLVTINPSKTYFRRTPSSKQPRCSFLPSPCLATKPRSVCVMMKVVCGNVDVEIFVVWVPSLPSAGVYPPLFGLQEGRSLRRPPTGQRLVPPAAHAPIQFVRKPAGHARQPCCFFRNHLLLISLADRLRLTVPNGDRPPSATIAWTGRGRDWVSADVTRPHRPQWLPLLLGQEWPMSFPVRIQMSVRARTIWKWICFFVFYPGRLWCGVDLGVFIYRGLTLTF